MTELLRRRDPADCRYDVVALGEVMLRLDPGEGRVRTARSFAVSEGGGEYNVARALRRVFGHRAALVTAIGDDEIGRLLEDLLLQGGVGLDHVVWKPSDGIGRQHRTPLNFTERGFGVRNPLTIYDRAHSAASTLRPDEVDWGQLFGELGVRWFHTGGIFTGLSDDTLATALAAIAAARRHGTVVSYDVNYRPSLWRAAGGPEAHRRLTEQIAGQVDVLFGVEADRFDETVADIAERSSTVRVIATTQRVVHSASRHDLAGVAWSRDGGNVVGAELRDLEVLDRIGSGDAFASGFVHGLLTGASLDEAVGLGVAHAALVMTTPGDTSSASLDEVVRLASGGDAGVIR